MHLPFLIVTAVLIYSDRQRAATTRELVTHTNEARDRLQVVERETYNLRHSKVSHEQLASALQASAPDRL